MRLWITGRDLSRILSDPILSDWRKGRVMIQQHWGNNNLSIHQPLKRLFCPIKESSGFPMIKHHWGNNILSHYQHHTYSTIFLPKSDFRRALVPLWSSSYGGELAKVATFCNKVIFLFPSCIWWISQWIVINVDGFGRKYLLDEPGAKFRPLPEFDGIWWWW